MQGLRSHTPGPRGAPGAGSARRLRGDTGTPAVSSSGTSANAASTPGRDFFQPGQEATSRQQLFNNIAPVYDEVSGQPWRPPGGRHGAASASSS
jgi:hypothetical protein